VWKRINYNMQNNKALGAHNVINEFIKYCVYEVRNKLLKIVNMIFEKGEVPSDKKHF